VIVPMVCGAAVGWSVWLGLRSLRARPVDLQRAVANLSQVRVEVDESTTSHRERIGSIVARTAQASGLITDRLLGELRIMNRSVERHAFDKVLLGAYGAALPLVVGTVLTLVGVAANPLAICAASVGAGVGGFVIPDLNLRREVRVRQRTFTFALGAYLELVTVILAGGAGVETALADAAAAGDGPAFAELRRALATCRLTGRTPWDAFAQLGEELGVPALSELAASVSLAGQQGAKVRASLTAKAESLRAHELATTEAEAQAATERMALPMVMLLLGFVLFIGYPAVVRVLTSL